MDSPVNKFILVIVLISLVISVVILVKVNKNTSNQQGMMFKDNNSSCSDTTGFRDPPASPVMVTQISQDCAAAIAQGKQQCLDYCADKPDRMACRDRCVGVIGRNTFHF